MSIIGTLERRAASGLDDSWYYPGGWFYGGTAGGGPTKSGSAVSEQTALRLAVVWCCVRILSEDSASLPLHLYRRLKAGGKERATDHPLYPLLHDSPNPEMTAMSFREALLAHVLSWGNGYAEIVRGKGKIGRSVVEALWPITPNRVTVKRNKGEITNLPLREIYYHISMTGSGLPDVDLPKAQVLHVPGLSFNGLSGYSPIAAAREAIGMGMSLEEFGASYFGGGIHPSIVVTHTGQLKDKGPLRQAINDMHAGMGKHNRALLLEETQKVEKLTIPNDEAQFLESRKYTNVDIGTRIYRLPPQMYGEYDKASTYASAEQFSIDYVGKTLRAWLVRLEQSMNMALLSPAERSTFFAEHLMDALVRGDLASRYTAYAVGRTNGWLNADEIREFENMNPQANGQGKIYLIQGAMVPVDQAGKNPIQKPTPPEPAPKRDSLTSAHTSLLADAIGRVTRKEAQRVTWLRKNATGNGAEADFWRDLPAYICQQTTPAFRAFAEALTAVEAERRGADLDAANGQTERFVGVFVAAFAAEYVDSSRALAGSGADWTERSADAIAQDQARRFAAAFGGQLAAILTLAGAPA